MISVVVVVTGLPRPGSWPLLGPSPNLELKGEVLHGFEKGVSWRRLVAVAAVMIIFWACGRSLYSHATASGHGHHHLHPSPAGRLMKRGMKPGLALILTILIVVAVWLSPASS